MMAERLLAASLPNLKPPCISRPNTREPQEAPSRAKRQLGLRGPNRPVTMKVAAF
jgi:hypothetical protein